MSSRLDGHTVRVLHLDDEENQLKFAKHFLERANPALSIEYTSSPFEALEWLKEDVFDCVVSDYKMPEMNGIDFARRVRETSEIPFILYTGHGSEEVAEEAFSIGIDDYFRKEPDPSHYQVLAKRITLVVERHKAVIELHRNQELLSSFMDEAPVSIHIYDSDLCLIGVNRKARETGLITGKDLGKHILEMNPRLEEIERYGRYLDVLESGKPFTAEVAFDEDTFNMRHTSIRAFKVLDGLALMFTDISESKRVEEELRKSEERYRTIVENSPNAISVSVDDVIVYVNQKRMELTGYTDRFRLLGTVGIEKVVPEDQERVSKRLSARDRGESTAPFVEFRMRKLDGSVIHVVDHVSFIEWQGEEAVMHILLDITERKNAEEMIQTIRDSVKRADELMEAFRDQIRDVPLQLKPVDLGGLVRRSVEEVQAHPKVVVSLDLGEGMDEVMLDGSRMRRVMDNLISNALEAMPEGGELRVSADTEGDSLKVSVSDTGVGIPEDQVPDLYEPFRSTKKSGLGLGLAYCKKTVEAHGGEIMVDSVVGKGTTFTILMN